MSDSVVSSDDAYLDPFDDSDEEKEALYIATFGDEEYKRIAADLGCNERQKKMIQRKHAVLSALAKSKKKAESVDDPRPLRLYHDVPASLEQIESAKRAKEANDIRNIHGILINPDFKENPLKHAHDTSYRIIDVDGDDDGEPEEEDDKTCDMYSQNFPNAFKHVQELRAKLDGRKAPSKPNENGFWDRSYYEFSEKTVDSYDFAAAVFPNPLFSTKSSPVKSGKPFKSLLEDVIDQACNRLHDIAGLKVGMLPHRASQALSMAESIHEMGEGVQYCEYGEAFGKNHSIPDFTNSANNSTVGDGKGKATLIKFYCTRCMRIDDPNNIHLAVVGLGYYNHTTIVPPKNLLVIPPRQLDLSSLPKPGSETLKRLLERNATPDVPIPSQTGEQSVKKKVPSQPGEKKKKKKPAGKKRANTKETAAATKKTAAKETGNFRARLDMFALFPHDSQCDQPPETTFTFQMDKQRSGVGSGVAKIPFNYDAIFGDTLNGILEVFDRYNSWDNPPPGVKIDNLVYPNKVVPYKSDNRQMEYLPSPRLCYYNKLHPEKWLGLVYRLHFAIACLPLMCYGLSHKALQYPYGNQRWRFRLTVPGFSSEDKPREPYMVLNSFILLFNGQSFEQIPDKVRNQILHGDITKVKTEDGQEWYTSTNPELKNLNKPGGILIPIGRVSGSRTIVGMVDGEVVDITTLQGFMTVFHGDWTHGGKAFITDEDDVNWHAAIHFYMDTPSLHERNFESYEIDLQAVARFAPENADRLDSASREIMFDTLYAPMRTFSSSLLNSTTAVPPSLLSRIANAGGLLQAIANERAKATKKRLTKSTEEELIAYAKEEYERTAPSEAANIAAERAYMEARVDPLGEGPAAAAARRPTAAAPAAAAAYNR